LSLILNLNNSHSLFKEKTMIILSLL